MNSVHGREQNGLLFRLRRSLVRLTQIGEAVAERKESENGQVLLGRKGEAIERELPAEERKRAQRGFGGSPGRKFKG